MRTALSRRVPLDTALLCSALVKVLLECQGSAYVGASSWLVSGRRLDRAPTPA